MRDNTPDYNVLNLRLNYLFKGPVLELDLRIKMRLENNFSVYCTLLLRKGSILDLGCGYGYISYMLMLTSPDRVITGVDHDSAKITIAGNLRDMLRNIADWTPLDGAASVGATEVAAQLIAAGADVNAAGPAGSTSGATPLLRAVGNEHSDTVKLLLEHGANPDTAYVTGAGSTPLMLAAGQGNMEIAGLLVAHGARTDLKDNEHTTALYRAVNSGKVKAVQLLLAHGANPNERNPQNYPLLIATMGNNSDPNMAAAFLKAKADVNAADSSGQTALFYAVGNGRKDLAEMLLAAGAEAPQQVAAVMLSTA